MARKSVLGKGLGDILSEIGQNYESQFKEVINEESSEVVGELDIDLIDPNPYQPRKYFDEEKLKELADSIKQHGLLQPIVVIEHNERYILIAGERRLRASKLANLQTIKAIIAQVELDELRLRELALIENIQRENLNPIELALSYKELLEVHNITHEELANIVNKSRSQITNTLRLLHLSDYAKDALLQNKITQGHAKILVNLSPQEQKIVVDSIVGQKLSVRETEELLKKHKKSNKEIKSVTKRDKKFIIPKELGAKIKEELPFKVKIKAQSVEILLDSEKELRKFIDFIKKS